MKITILGIPMPKQSDRTRIAKGKNGNYIAHYQPKGIVDEEERIRNIARAQIPFDFRPSTLPVKVTKLHYIFPMPTSFLKKQVEYVKNGGIIRKTTKPDVTDNLNKLLFDALQGIIYVNDSQVTDMDNVRKYYGLEPRTELELEFIQLEEL